MEVANRDAAPRLGDQAAATPACRSPQLRLPECVDFGGHSHQDRAELDLLVNILGLMLTRRADAPPCRGAAAACRLCPDPVRTKTGPQRDLSVTISPRAVP